MSRSDSGKPRKKAPCYAPTSLIFRTGLSSGFRVRVIAHIAHPPTQPPTGCQNVPSRVRLECQTAIGSLWFGCDRAYVDETHQMVVVGLEAALWRYWYWPTITTKVS